MNAAPKKHPVKSVAFLRIHPGNLPLALAFSCLHPVYYWKSSFVSQRLLRRFHLLDPQDITTLPEWDHHESEAHRFFKLAGEKIHERQRQNTTSIAGREVDFSRLISEAYGMRAEEYLHFLHMCRKMNISHAADANPFVWKKELDIDLPCISEYAPRLMRSADRFWLWSHTSLRIIKAVKTTLSLLLKPRVDKKAAVLWKDISPAEVPEDENCLDATFLVRDNYLKKDDVLYLLPDLPSTGAQKTLDSRGVNWHSIRHMQTLLARTERLALLLDQLKVLLAGIFVAGQHSLQIWSLKSMAEPWARYLDAIKPSVCVNSMGSIWPIPPEMALLKPFEINSITWFYSCNDFYFGREAISHAGLGPEFAMTPSDDLIFWNEMHLEFNRNRSLATVSQNERRHVVGPLMAGRSELLQNSPEELRNRSGLIESVRDSARYIGIFDVPTLTQSLRLRAGTGPNRVPYETNAAFYDDLLSLLEHYPDINLVIKPKRSLNDRSRIFAPALLELTDPKNKFIRNGRVTLLPANIDPYLAVSLCDFCIGLPFASVIYAAVASGRKGCFYDPDGSARYSLPRENERLMTSGKHELFGLVAKWLSDNDSWHPLHNGRSHGHRSFTQESIAKAPTKLFAEVIESRISGRLIQ